MSAGKRGHAFAGGSGDPQAAVAAIVATTAATRAMTLTVKVSASGDAFSSLEWRGRRCGIAPAYARRRMRRGGLRSRVSWISSTFSAFRSPEREKLNDPTKTTSSATTTFACMKSCSDSGVQRVDGLPANGAPVRIVRSSGIFQRADAVRRPLVEDLVDLRLVDHAGDVAAALVHDLDERAEDRAGREHGGRDPDPRSRPAEELRHAVRESVPYSGREPGADLRLLVDGHGPRLDATRVLDLAAAPELVEVEGEARASAGAPSTRTITFSCRLHESSVQLVDPDHTSVPSRTTYL